MEKKVGVEILTSDKTDFKPKDEVRHKEGYYIMLKGSIQQEGITLVNIYAPNKEAPKYIKQILMNIKGDIDNNTVIVEDFNTPLTSMYRSSRQKINKKTMALSEMLDQINLISPQCSRIYILFKCTWNIF